MKINLKRTAALILSSSMLSLFAAAEYYSEKLPVSLMADRGKSIEIAAYPHLSCTKDGDKNAEVSLFGAIPVKNIEIDEREIPILAVGGNTFGIKLLMQGVLVTGLGEVIDENGIKCCPADEAGLKKGDIIKTVNNIPVDSNSQFQDIVNSAENITLSVQRDGENFKTDITPAVSAAGGRKCGMWIRDSIAGIGTMTFIDPETGKFGGLGHPICDTDTGELIPVQSGEAVTVEITDAKKGAAGIPGEIHGRFSGESCGELTLNTDTGVYGTLNEEALKNICSGTEMLRLGCRQDITEGDACIYTSVCGEAPQKYSAVIERVDYSSDDTKNMIIRITDEELIERTGGIIQGMSGSPIIQNDKIIGAVTHVFVADPTRGYGIFAENMIKDCEG
ncbi:MAG: SpoIVB peptidase [Ruminococcus sp.]|nr:SpoIVB peptidase [Ruminococcus sp.]